MKLLGIADLFAALMLITRSFRIEIPLGLLFCVLFYLSIKSLIALLSIGGLIDMGVVVLLIISIFFILPPLVFYIGAFLIGQKGFLSLLTWS